MRRIAKKVLLPVLCAVALFASAFGMMSLTGSATGSAANQIIARYDGADPDHGVAGDGIVTAWDILAKDGYIEGVWLPWLTHTYLGSGLASNPDMEDWDSYLTSAGTTKDYWQTMTQIGINNYNNTQLEMEIFNLKALGYNVLAYAGSPWAEGRINDTDTWECTGVREEYLTNIRKLLDICRKVGMPVAWYIHFHSSAVSPYTTLDMWYRIDQVKANKEYAESYAENFVKPVCQVLSEYRDVVVMCGISDETFNEINDSEAGDKFAEGDREQYGVTQEDSMYFHSQIGQMVKTIMPDMPTTCADNKSDYAMFADAMLDMPGRNQYSSGTSASTSVAESWATGPLLAGEYGMGDSSTPTEDVWSSTITGKRDAYLNAGYSGFFLWCYQPTFNAYKSATGNQLTKQGATTPYDFRLGAYAGYYWSDAKKASLGTGNTAGGPSAMYYCGTSLTYSVTNSSNVASNQTTSFNGKIYWIQPESTTSYTVQRSTDGGSTWTTISGTVSIDSDTGSHRYCMTDPSPVTSGTVQYRITANGLTSYTNEWTY